MHYFETSTDYSIWISIDAIGQALMRGLNVLTKLTRSALAFLIARNIVQLECFQDENEALDFINQS